MPPDIDPGVATPPQGTSGTPPAPATGASSASAAPAPPPAAPPGDETLLDPGKQFRFLLRIPWEKSLIWVLFLSLIYALRDFFGIIFMTFIFTYMSKNAVDYVMRRLRHEGGAGRKYVVAGVFTLEVVLIFFLGLMLLPRFYDQANAFVRQVKNTDIKAQIETTLQKTIGKEAFIDLQASDWYKDQLVDWTKKATAAIPSLTGWITQTLLNVLTFLLHFFLSLVFSLLIVLDIPKLGRNFGELEEGRFKDFYHEIAPTLLTFGTVLGRAFQAQAAIAVVNTILTFLGLVALGIQSPVFLCVIVFICSFIPVLGVVISSVPISLMALQQEGVVLMLEVIALILIIHAIEAYILNPKIVGDIMKMHPLIVLIILFLSEHYFGLWGLLLGVPVTFYVYRHVIQGKSEDQVFARPTPRGSDAPPPAGSADATSAAIP